MTDEQKRKSDQEYEDRFWETYLNLAAEEDKHLPDNWEANTGGILTFVSIADNINLVRQHIAD